MAKPKAFPLPDDFAPQQKTLTSLAVYLAKHRRTDIDLDEAFLHFQAWHQSKGTEYVSWDAAFRTWIYRQVSMSAAPSGPDYAGVPPLIWRCATCKQIHERPYDTQPHPPCPGNGHAKRTELAPEPRSLGELARASIGARR